MVDKQMEGLSLNDNVTPEYVRTLTEPTEKFLCTLSDNWADFRFRGFKIRDMVSNITLVEVPDSAVEQPENLQDDVDPSKR